MVVKMYLAFLEFFIYIQIQLDFNIELFPLKKIFFPTCDVMEFLDRMLVFRYLRNRGCFRYLSEDITSSYFNKLKENILLCPFLTLLVSS